MCSYYGWWLVYCTIMLFYSILNGLIHSFVCTISIFINDKVQYRAGRRYGRWRIKHPWQDPHYTIRATDHCCIQSIRWQPPLWHSSLLLSRRGGQRHAMLRWCWWQFLSIALACSVWSLIEDWQLVGQNPKHFTHQVSMPILHAYLKQGDVLTMSFHVYSSCLSETRRRIDNG